jgi:Flp pilus assembly protein TadB
MQKRPDQETLNRVRQARQVIAGSEVRPPSPFASSYASNAGYMTPSQRTYLFAVGGIFVLALLLWLVFSMSVASIIFFILSLLLIAGWLVF